MVEYVSAGYQGPRGPVGPPGDARSTIIAGENIGGHRAVTINSDGKAIYASTTNVLHANRVVGLTTNAASPDGELVILRNDEVTEPSWNWNLSLPIYLGYDGLLTQTPNAESLFTLIVGFPISTTKIYFSIGTPIIK